MLQLTLDYSCADGEDHALASFAVLCAWLGGPGFSTSSVAEMPTCSRPRTVIRTLCQFSCGDTGSLQEFVAFAQCVRVIVEQHGR